MPANIMWDTSDKEGLESEPRWRVYALALFKNKNMNDRLILAIILMMQCFLAALGIYRLSEGSVFWGWSLIIVNAVFGTINAIHIINKNK